MRQADKYGISVDTIGFNYVAMKERKDGVVARVRKGLEGLIASNQIAVFQGYGKFLSPYEVKVIGGQEALLQGKTIIIATGSEPRALPNMPFDVTIFMIPPLFSILPRCPKSF